MTRNYYDQAARYMAKLDPGGFVRWPLRMPTLLFHSWLDTRRLPFPGEADRICDTVACLEDPAVAGVLWAVPIEFALEPESDLFGRLLAYLGLLWLEERPSTVRGVRYQVGAVVINLTGRGHTSREMRLAGLHTCLTVVEVDLCDLDAADVLADIVAGLAPACLLPLIPLMQGGAEPAIIAQWVQVVSAQPNARQGDYAGLARVFAEAANCRPVWEQATQGFTVIQSQQVLEWMAEGKAGILLRVLRARFGAVPTELEASILAQTDPAQLDLWADAAATAPNLADFRQATNL